MQYWQQNSNSVIENTIAAMKIMSFFSIMAIKAFYIIRPYLMLFWIKRLSFCMTHKKTRTGSHAQSYNHSLNLKLLVEKKTSQGTKIWVPESLFLCINEVWFSVQWYILHYKAALNASQSLCLIYRILVELFQLFSFSNRITYPNFLRFGQRNIRCNRYGFIMHVR